jgi:hypothetical protein
MTFQHVKAGKRGNSTGNRVKTRNPVKFGSKKKTPSRFS